MERTFLLMILCVILLLNKRLFVETAHPGVRGNLALGKKGSQSSRLTAQSGWWKAMDGDVESGASIDMAATKKPPDDKNPWLRLDLGDFYLVQTVEIVRRIDCCFLEMETLEVRVGTSVMKNHGNTNELCGEPVDMTTIPTHVFRCEIHGRYINVKKTNQPVPYLLAIAEFIVNAEPTTNFALGKITTGAPPANNRYGSEKAVDGKCGNKFFTKYGVWPAWLMIDFGEIMTIVKIFIFHRENSGMTRIVMTIGNDPASHGQINPRFGGIHDFSKAKVSTFYLKPRILGRYAYFESLTEDRMIFNEVEFYSECMPFIEERTNGLGSYSVTFYTDGQQAVLPCHSFAYPAPYIAWVSNGVVLQNRTSDQDTNLVVIANGTKGTTTDYECWASNIHGKDLYVVTATRAGRYDMCIKPEEVRDPSRNRFSKQDTTKEMQNDKDSFDASKMNSFFNPLSSLYMKLTTSCPPPSSCGTGAPGWLPDGHPKPEDGIVRRKVCFHYDGNCCYKALYIDVINCPGMYVYGLVNTVFDFAARYCFEDDKKNEAFAPFRSVPLLFAPVGGSNTALVNHVIAKDDGIEDTSQCLIVCMMSKCRSLNFDKLKKICEVNDVTKDEYPRDLTAKPGFQYYHPMGQPVVVNRGRN